LDASSALQDPWLAIAPGVCEGSETRCVEDAGPGYRAAVMKSAASKESKDCCVEAATRLMAAVSKGSKDVSLEASGGYSAAVLKSAASKESKDYCVRANYSYSTALMKSASSKGSKDYCAGADSGYSAAVKKRVSGRGSKVYYPYSQDLLEAFKVSKAQGGDPSETPELIRRRRAYTDDEDIKTLPPNSPPRRLDFLRTARNSKVTFSN
jgi:hypothetical protein